MPKLTKAARQANAEMATLMWQAGESDLSDIGNRLPFPVSTRTVRRYLDKVDPSTVTRLQVGRPRSGYIYRPLQVALSSGAKGKREWRLVIRMTPRERLLALMSIATGNDSRAKIKETETMTKLKTIAQCHLNLTIGERNACVSIEVKAGVDGSHYGMLTSRSVPVVLQDAVVNGASEGVRKARFPIGEYDATATVHVARVGPKPWPTWAQLEKVDRLTKAIEETTAQAFKELKQKLP